MVQKLHTSEMSKGKPQRITHLETHFHCTMQAVLQIFNCLRFPQGIFQQHTPYIFISDENVLFFLSFFFPLASSQTNLITFQMGTNLHIATSPCCISQTSNNLHDFLEVIEIFHSPPSSLCGGAAESTTNQNQRNKEIWLRK